MKITSQMMKQKENAEYVDDCHSDCIERIVNIEHKKELNTDEMCNFCAYELMYQYDVELMTEQDVIEWYRKDTGPIDWPVRR